jgi:hypothetical protein
MMQQRLGGLLVIFLALGTGAAAALAQETEKKAADLPATALPLSRVVLFNSGVGFFEHQGKVDGNAKVDLQFRVEDINDLLKSMVLEDLDGGKISSVSYGSRDPITKTLKTFPIDLTDNPTLGQILDQVRGERVEVEAPTPIAGVLLGVERRKKEVGKDDDVIETEYLNLLTDAGLRTVPMESIGRIKLVNDKLDAELRQALQVLARGHNTDKKTVTLNMLGQGNRAVRVGYIQSAPVWKTSYRLVLADKQPAFLQGWAIVENTTEGDWENVALTLVSGRPISYRMDLYEPLYVERPLERLNLYASLRAQTYGQDLAKDELRFREMAKSRPAQMGRSIRREAGADSAGGAMEAPAAAPPAAAPAEAFVDASAARNSVDSAAAGEVGELFQYQISTPVTLQRQKSAMLPIVNGSVQGEKVSIYNQNVQAKHPLSGLKLINDTGLHLMQGPITVFDGGAYAGDAKIEDLPPKSERLISYALDLKTEVAPEMKGHPEQLLSVKIVKGTMEVSRKLARTNSFTIKNSDTREKTVLIEVPYEASWNLVSPKEPAEKTRDTYRFAVKAEPGKPATLEVVEEQIVGQSLALANLDENTILFYLSQKNISQQVRNALQEVIKRKQALQQVAVERQNLERQIKAISEEQERIRKNMEQLERNTDLYKRYVQKFNSQEDTVEKFREQIQKITTDEQQKRRALDDYLINLNL